MNPEVNDARTAADHACTADEDALYRAADEIDRLRAEIDVLMGQRDYWARRALGVRT